MKYYLIIILLLAIPAINPVHAQDYSSDFEYNMMQQEDQSRNYDDHPIGSHSPSAEYYRTKEAQKERKIIDNIYRRQEYGYGYRPMYNRGSRSKK